MTNQKILSLLKGFTYDNEALVLEKCERFLNQTNRIHVVADFDRTLTVRRPENNDDITSWNILRDHLPKQQQIKCRELFEKAWPKEVAGTMTVQDAVEWWSAVLDIYAQNHLDMNEVERDFLQRASIRPGAKELFTLCHTSNIPTVILSAGVKDVIDLWSATYAIEPTLVISTELELDDARRIIGWKKDTLVHILNKSETNHSELTRIRGERPLAILFGDSMNDVDMAAGDKNVLRVRIFDPRPGETIAIEAERTKTFQSFDVMIESGNVNPLVALIKTLTAS